LREEISYILPWTDKLTYAGISGAIKCCGRGVQLYIPSKYKWLFNEKNYVDRFPRTASLFINAEEYCPSYFVKVLFGVKSVPEIPEGWASIIENPDLYDFGKKKPIGRVKRSNIRGAHPEYFVGLPIRNRDKKKGKYNHGEESPLY
jgi:hypothetical protein